MLNTLFVVIDRKFSKKKKREKRYFQRIQKHRIQLGFHWPNTVHVEPQNKQLLSCIISLNKIRICEGILMQTNKSINR